MDNKGLYFGDNLDIDELRKKAAKNGADFLMISNEYDMRKYYAALIAL